MAVNALGSALLSTLGPAGQQQQQQNPQNRQMLAGAAHLSAGPLAPTALCVSLMNVVDFHLVCFSSCSRRVPFAH
jgi:hypothetical protein